MYSHTLRMAYGNGLGADIWEEFQRRFKMERIVEWYTATEASGGFINVDGKIGSVGRYSWLAEVRRVRIVGWGLWGVWGGVCGGVGWGLLGCYRLVEVLGV